MSEITKWRDSKFQAQVRAEILERVYGLLFSEALRPPDTLKACESLARWIGMDKGLEPELEDLLARIDKYNDDIRNNYAERADEQRYQLVS